MAVFIVTGNCDECGKELDADEEVVERHQFNGCHSEPYWICLDCWETLKCT